MIYHVNSNRKSTGMATLMSDFETTLKQEM